MILNEITKLILPDKTYRLFLKIYLKVKKPFETIIFEIKLKKVKQNHEKALQEIRTKKKIKVAFFFINSDTWKYDLLYKHFRLSKRFEPVVVICPFIKKGNDFLQKELRKSIAYCNNKDYNFVIGYDNERNASIAFKEFYKPDIVFFSNPNNLTTEEFLISNYLDTLTCYVPYSFRIDSLYNYGYNNNLTNLTWRNFYETTYHKELAVRYSKSKGSNVIVTGHPNLDRYNLTEKPNIHDPWKIIDSKPRKRIIWGPHWTIKGYQNTGLDWACFLDYADFFFDLASEFIDSAQFAIKPHPFLRLTLEKENLWGKSKATEYFEKWNEGLNMQLVEGDYLELFLHSDALLHDSGAFMVEYLPLNKPTAYTINDLNLLDSFNDFGISALQVHKKIANRRELKKFVKDVINQHDEMATNRQDFIKKYFDNFNLSASEKIVNHINSLL